MKSLHYGAFCALVLAVCLVLPGKIRAQFTADGTNANATNWSSNTTADSTPAFIAKNGGNITSTGNASGTTSGLASFGVYVETGGAVDFSGGTTITTTGQNADGLIVITDGSITFNDATVTASGPNARGARALGADAVLTVTDVDFTAAGLGVLTQQGATTTITGGTIAAGDGGLEVTGGSSLSASGATITTGSGGGSSNHGVYAWDNSTVDIANSSITTAGNVSHGLYAVGGSTITSTTNAVTTAGTAARGALATGVNSIIHITGGSIDTTGGGANGLEASSGGTVNSTDAAITTTNGGSPSNDAHGAHATAGSAIHLTGGSVSAAGHGLYANGVGAEITSSSVSSISTTGGDRHGALAQNDSTITITGDTAITTDGNSSRGLFARLRGVIEAQGEALAIATSGTAAHGAEAEANSRISVTGGSIATSGGQAYGLRAIGANAVVEADNVAVSTTSGGAYGAAAQNSGDITLTGGSVSTSGQGSVGLFSNAATITSSAIVTADGLYGQGLWASAGGVVDQSDGNVTTTGDYAEGMKAIGAGSRITNTGNAVETGGLASHAAAARLGGLLEIRDSLLRTTGDEAAGVAVIARVRGDMAPIAGEAASFADLVNTTIETAGGPALLADEEASGEFTLDQVTAEENNGLWLEALANSTLDLTADQSRFRGAAVTDASAMTTVELGTSTYWDLTGNSNLTSLTVRDSEIQFASAGGYKTLTAVDYTGDNALVGLNTFLGTDGDPSDLIIIDGGAATGNTLLQIRNSGGPGAQTFAEGIKVVDAINGGTTEPDSFALDPNQAGAYEIEGKTAVAAGAYGYTLHRGARQPEETVEVTAEAGSDKVAATKAATAKANGSDPYGDLEFSDDWYLRNVLELVAQPVPGPVPVSPPPLFSPATPIYEAYPSVLLGQLRLPTLQQRVGTRYWRNSAQPAVPSAKAPVPDAKQPLFGGGKAPRFSAKEPLPAKNAPPTTDRHALIEGTAAWGRLTGSLASFDERGSTTGAEMDTEQWQFQFGVDGLLHEGDRGRWIVGLNGHYGRSDADIGSFFGNGRIDAEGYGLGATATWYGDSGFYVDTQAQVTWFESDLFSDTLRSGLASGNDAFGWATGIEAGQRIEIARDLHLVPQVQVTYSDVRFDNFTDPFGARVSLDEADQWIGRAGLALEHQKSWTAADGTNSRRSLYGILNARHRFDEGTKVDVNGVKFLRDGASTWGGLGVGLSRNWQDDRYSLYGEVEADTDLEHFGDSWRVGGNIGLRVAF